MMMNNKSAALLIVAAGSSSRMGSIGKKEYLSLNGGTVLSETVAAFFKAVDFQTIVTVHPRNGENDCKKAFFSGKIEPLKNDSQFAEKCLFVEGGSSRQESVFNGLKALSSLKKLPDIVFIHDGARPFVSKKIILATFEAACEFGASVPALTPTDTQKEIDENGFIKRHLVRSTLAAVQTPQVFNFNGIFEAHKKAEIAAANGEVFTDDTEIWDRFASANSSTKIVAGDPENIKITYPQDVQQLPSTKD